MKGIVFTEFMELVEGKFGMDMVDDLIDETQPVSGGSYTSVGTYDYDELVGYVQCLSTKTEIPIPDLIRVFGHHLAHAFATKFPSFFSECGATIEFLKKVDDHIHVEVRKLYPDAELPKFDFEESTDEGFTLLYSSTRGLADLAYGLIEGCAKHFGESFNIKRTDGKEGDLFTARFVITALQ